MHAQPYSSAESLLLFLLFPGVNAQLGTTEMRWHSVRFSCHPVQDWMWMDLFFFVNWGWRWNVCKTVTQRKSYMEREGEVFGAVHSEKLVQMYSKLLQYKQPALKVPFHWALKTLPSNAANSLIKRNPAQSRKSFLWSLSSEAWAMGLVEWQQSQREPII